MLSIKQKKASIPCLVSHLAHVVFGLFGNTWACLNYLTCRHRNTSKAPSCYRGSYRSFFQGFFSSMFKMFFFNLCFYRLYFPELQLNSHPAITHLYIFGYAAHRRPGQQMVLFNLISNKPSAYTEPPNSLLLLSHRFYFHFTSADLYICFFC